MVYLLPDEIKILSEIENCGWVSESKIENEDSLHILESMGMVESFTTKGEPMYIISDRGKRWISLHKENQKKFKSSEIRGWITTTIAVLAFLMSLISLSWQYLDRNIELKESQTQEQSTMVEDYRPSNQEFFG
mgnify:CR=1 FL=1